MAHLFQQLKIKKAKAKNNKAKYTLRTKKVTKTTKAKTGTTSSTKKYAYISKKINKKGKYTYKY